VLRPIALLGLPLFFLTYLCCPARAQGSSNLVLEGTVPLPPCTTGDVWALGDYMLLARRTQGFAIADVRDPKNPIVKTIVPPGYPTFTGNYGVGDIKSDGRYIYATDEGTGKGVFIYDAVDPMHPVLLTTLAAIGHPSNVHNCWIDVANQNLYTNNNEIFDVSDPAKPVFLTRITTAFAHDIAVFDNRAYLSLWTSGFAIYDVSSPRVPRLLGQQSYAGAATHNVWPSADRNYLFTTDENTGGHLRVWDISRLPAITEVGSYTTGPAGGVVHNVQVDGDLVYLSYYKEGLRVLDVSSPPSPVEIAHYDTYSPTGSGCFGGPYAGNWGVYPWVRDKIFVSDMDSGGYVLRLSVIDEAFAAKSSTVPAGAAIQLDFSYQNNGPTALDAFGVVLLSAINGSPAVYPLVVDLSRLGPSQQATQPLTIPVPAGFPGGWAVDFVGYAGLAPTLTITETVPVRVTIQ